MARAGLIIVAMVMMGGAVGISGTARAGEDTDNISLRIKKFYSEGAYSEAIPLAERLLQIRERTLPANHRDIALALRDLADMYRLQGRYAKAEPLYKRLLNILEKNPASDRRDVVVSLDSLGLLYLAQGRYSDAQATLKRSIAIGRKALGNDDLDLARSLNSLGELYRLQGDPVEAEALYQRALAIRSKVGNQLDVAETESNLAKLYVDQKRYADAEPLFIDALSIRKRMLYPAHAAVGAIAQDLGNLYRVQGRLNEADELLEQAHSILVIALGSDHPQVGESILSLAQLRQDQNRINDAMALYGRGLGILESALGPYHPKVGTAVSELAGLYFQEERWADAAQLLLRGTNVIIFSAKGYRRIEDRSLTPLDENEAVRNKVRFMALVKAAYRGGLNESVSEAEEGSEAERWLESSELPRESVLPPAPKNDRMQPPQGEIERDEIESLIFRTAQWATRSQVATSLTEMAARKAGVDGELSRLVRQRQDAFKKWHTKDRELIALRAQPSNQLVRGFELGLEGELFDLENEIRSIDETLRETKKYADYALLAHPQPISIAVVQEKLQSNEALIFFFDVPQWKSTPEETFIWAVTKTGSRWTRSEFGSKALQERVAQLRCGLDRSGEWYWSKEKRRWIAHRHPCASLRPEGLAAAEPLPFELARAHELYEGLFGDIEDVIKGKQLLVVPSGALTALPFQVLVTAPPATNDLNSAAWLIREHALTVLPSVSGLAALRRSAVPEPLPLIGLPPFSSPVAPQHNVKVSAAPEPFIGFGDPELSGSTSCGKIEVPDTCPDENLTVAALPDLFARVSPMLTTVASYFRNGHADVAEVRKLCPLPDTAHELKCVAHSLGAPESSIILGKNMTEKTVKTIPLDRYRIVHFATHGLLAGQTAQLAKINAEPALVFTPPDKPTDEDDGLLTASEVTGLKLNADWVVMSACNTAGGEGPGAEALSGLARAFFYAGARALLVSHWPVNSYAATMLTSRTFAELKTAASIGRSEAFRRAMLALMSDPKRPWAAHPSVWAPFVVVGEGGAQESLSWPP